MKTIKDLEKCLNVIKNKGFLLSSSSYIDYDIDSIITKNLENCRREYFNKYNVLELKSDKVENFKMKDNIGNRKDFEEIKKEIKEYFNKRSTEDLINEVLKEVSLRFRYPKGITCYYDMNKLSFEEIEENLYLQHKKELIFQYYSQYSLTGGIKETMLKITTLFNLVLKLKINIDYTSLKYNDSIETIKELINTSQDIFNVRIFMNGNIKIKFKDTKQQEKIRELLINDKYQTYKKEFYILLDVLDKEDLFNLDSLIIYTNKVNCFANIKMNNEEHKKYIAKYDNIAILDGSLEWNMQDNFSCVAHINKSDSFKYAIARINETDFNAYLKRTASEIALSYCNFNCGLIKSLK